MKWIRKDQYHYLNTDQIRDIQFITKSAKEFFYRVFYANGQFTEIKGFDTFEDAFEHADKTFGLTISTSAVPGTVVEYLPKEKSKATK